MTDQSIHHRDAGFGPFGVLLIVLVIVIALGAIFGSQVAGVPARIASYLGLLNANAIFGTGASIGQGINVMGAQGWDISQINLVDDVSSDSSRVSLFDPINGAITEPALSKTYFIDRPSGISADNWGRFYLVGNTTSGAGSFTVPDLASSNADWAIVLPGVKDDYCQGINEALLSYDADAAIPIASSISSTSLYAGLSTAQKVTSTAFSLASTTPSDAFSGAYQGCFQSSDGVNAYFLVVSPR
ncbi:hypothetical protein [Nisaea sediminum]|jgi:hypothetical protein|uniref:hypothetical protein n=2 Tax=Pseudomonadota TaxID=1224 RepID=UPI0018692AD4|nr:hypothetical protein [Nisaea sediminum]